MTIQVLVTDDQNFQLIFSKMKLSEVWQHQLNNSTKTSESLRQLSFSGIALIWIFRDDAQTESVTDDLLPFKLIIAGILLASSLFMDVLQYFITAHKFRNLALKTAKTLTTEKVPVDKQADHVLDLPSGFHTLAGYFYYTKFACAIAAYGFIIAQVGSLLGNVE
jgi:hypothetical protein